MKYNEEVINRMLGQRIRTLRSKNKITQQQLAADLEISRTSITNIEAGGQKISVHLLYEVSRALNVTFLELLPSIEDVAREGVNLPPETAKFVKAFFEDKL